jgi:hypothetical protein
MKTKNLKRKLILLGLIAVCLLQYPFLALMITTETVYGVPFTLIYLVLVWLFIIIAINFLLIPKNVKDSIREK